MTPLIDRRAGASRFQHATFHQAIGAILARLRRVHTTLRQRRELLELDDRMLRDIGVSREEAELEARKPWWL